MFDNNEGFNGTTPKLIELTFQPGKIELHFEDGRQLIVPINRFPSIHKLTEVQRKKWHITDDEIIWFDDANEAFHIEQFLGTEANYQYKGIKNYPGGASLTENTH